MPSSSCVPPTSAGQSASKRFALNSKTPPACCASATSIQKISGHGATRRDVLYGASMISTKQRSCRTRSILCGSLQVRASRPNCASARGGPQRPSLQATARASAHRGRRSWTNTRRAFWRLVAITDREREEFWREVAHYPKARPPGRVRRSLRKSLPPGVTHVRFASRVKGGGSLGRARYVAIAEWNGGRILREAKAVVPSAWDWAHGAGRAKLHFLELSAGRFRSPDPSLTVERGFVIRRIAPEFAQDRPWR